MGRIIPIVSALKFEECESCAFHQIDEGVCEDCEEADNFFPAQSDDRLKEAA